MFSKCKCRDNKRCKEEFGYHILHNPTPVPVTKKHFKPSQPKINHRIRFVEKQLCIGCKKIKKMENLITIGFKTSTEEIEICNLCYKIFAPIFSEIAIVLKFLESETLEIQ
jgi:hypothetical protein